MISDRAIQHYIIEYILCNPTISLYEAARNMCRYLRLNFIPNEIVFLKHANLEARVLCGALGVFQLVVYDAEGSFPKEVTFDEIERALNIKVKHIIQFLDMSTKVSPNGRVFKAGILDDKDSTMELFVDISAGLGPAVMPLSNQSLEYYYRENTHICLRKKRKYMDVGTLLLYMKCPRISARGISNMPLLMEVFSFFATFRGCLDIDLSLEELVAALRDRKYSSEMAFKIHAGLLYIIKHELKGLCSYERQLFFCAAADACISTDVDENVTMNTFYAYNWRRMKVTMKSWRNVLKMLFSYICNELKIYKIAHFEKFFDRSCEEADVRLCILKFLIECACSTRKLRRTFNSRVRNWKKKKSQNSFEESIQNCETTLDCMKAKCDIGCVDDVHFILVENCIFFVRHGYVFQMHTCHIKAIVRSLAPKTGGHRSLIKSLAAYVTAAEKRLCDII